MIRHRGRWTVPVLIAVLTAATAVLTGCIPIDESSTQDLLDRAPGAGKAAVAEDYENWLEGTSEKPDVSDSPKAAEDKEVMIISCGQSQSSCARGTKGAKEAADAMGWKSKIYDTSGNYSQAGSGIREAIASGMDGVFIYFIDCSYIQQPLKEAKAAGLPVVQAEGVDCNDSDPDAEPLFTYSVSYVEGDLLAWIEDFGAASAAYLITNTNGYANAVFVGDNASIGTQHVYKGFNSLMDRCPDCTSEIIKYSFDQMGQGISDDFQQKLLKRPDVDAVGVAYDSVLMSGIFNAVRQFDKSGRNILLTGGEGSSAAMEFVHRGLVSAGVGLDNEWEGWSGIDNLNRIFADAPTASSGIGIEIYDNDHNLPAAGAFTSKIDYKPVYENAWKR